MHYIIERTHNEEMKNSEKNDWRKALYICLLLLFFFYFLNPWIILIKVIENWLLILGGCKMYMLLSVLNRPKGERVLSVGIESSTFDRSGIVGYFYLLSILFVLFLFEPN